MQRRVLASTMPTYRWGQALHDMEAEGLLCEFDEK